MQQLSSLPPAFSRYARIGGALDFTIFCDFDGSEEQAIAAIGSAIPQHYNFDAGKLRGLRGRRIRDRKFFGDWYDANTGALIRVGDWRTKSGKDLHNPRLTTLDDVRIVSGASFTPIAGAGGNFAYAFTNPPYSLNARPGEVQQLFDEIREFIMPPEITSEILDWSSPRLPEVSNYFVSGMEWWGVFLFTIHVSDLRRLTIIMGSTTD